MAFVDVDEGRRPVVTFTVRGVDPSDEELDEFFAAFDRVLSARGRRVFLLFDLTGTAPVGLSKLRRISSYLKANKSQLRTRVRRTAIVLTNPLVKACIHTIFLVYRPERPWDTFSNHDRAGRWFATPMDEDPPSRPGTPEKCG